MPDVAIDAQDPWGFAANDPIGLVTLIRPVAVAVEGDSTSVVDPLPPVVTLVSPSTGQIEQSTPIVVEVTDNVALRRVLIAAVFESLAIEELVHNGERFGAAYSGASTRTPIAGGWRYSIRRNSGWPAPVRLEVYAYDTAGSEG